VPIVDVEFVSGAAAPGTSVQELADALGQVFGTPPGNVWVRVRPLDRAAYAENGVYLGVGELPVFVTILRVNLPQGAALQAEVAAVTELVAQWMARAPERVHVIYAPEGAGRQAFGGRLVKPRA
jgi:phenylpyruvate tautomerase PptA (4-oxalocrotonate tautomerase family)